MTELITEINGTWWPGDDDPKVREYLTHEAGIVDAISEVFGERKLAVQAGGHVGLFPLALAKHFERVITFEPCPLNFQCLMKNIAGNERIQAHLGALGEESGIGNLVRHPTNSGAHRMLKESGGEVPVYTIDEMRLEACDLIFLDVEGMERAVLDGASATLHRFRPALFLEDKGMSEAYGIKRRDIVHTLMSWGYRLRGETPHDVLMTAS